LPGHAKGDGSYILNRRPDYIIAGWAEGQPVADSPFSGDQQLAVSPDLARCYRLERAQLAYDPAYARVGPARPNPLTFTYYRRTC
jgi:hypothetical protein